MDWKELWVLNFVSSITVNNLKHLYSWKSSPQSLCFFFFFNPQSWTESKTIKTCQSVAVNSIPGLFFHYDGPRPATYHPLLEVYHSSTDHIHYVPRIVRKHEKVAHSNDTPNHLCSSLLGFSSSTWGIFVVLANPLLVSMVIMEKKKKTRKEILMTSFTTQTNGNAKDKSKESKT